MVPYVNIKKPVSLNEDMGTDVWGLKTTTGVFGTLSTTGSDNHSHSGFKKDKRLWERRLIDECHQSFQHRECGTYCGGGMGLGQDIAHNPDSNCLLVASPSCEMSAIG